MLKDLPLIAILRGITPSQVLDVANVLVEAGFNRIEVPLNSPDALSSIRLLVNTLGSEYSIGAGTVTNVDEAKAVIDTGANLVVTPNFNADVVKLAIAANCKCYPGVITPSECFAAIEAGATGLKFFPVTLLGLEGYKAIKSILPPSLETYPVGGINPNDESMHPFLSAGATGFGLGSSLYKPAMDLATIKQNARDFVTSFNAF